MSAIRRIHCPNERVHYDHKRILFAYEEKKGAPPTKFLIHCSHPKCHWLEVSFGDTGALSITEMDGQPHFDFENGSALVFRKNHEATRNNPRNTRR